MDRIDIEIDDFINYCDYKGLSKKTYGSYEQTLRLLKIYLKEKFKIDKTYELYIQLYKSLFDIQFSRQHISNLILCYKRENISNMIKNCFELALNEKNLDGIIQKFDNSMTIIDKFSVICESVLNAENFKMYFAKEFPQLEEGIIKEQTYFCIINIILSKLNLFNSIDVLSNDNLKKLNDITINIVENIVQEKQFDEAKKERDRILKGDFSKERGIQKQEIEYSNVHNGYEFEEYVANLYRKLGYTIEEVTKKSGDQGADVIAYKDNVKYVMQVKFYNNPVGNKAVQEVVGAIGMYKADKGIVITNSSFTPSAVELAQANNIELVNGEKIEELKKLLLVIFQTTRK